MSGENVEQFIRVSDLFRLLGTTVFLPLFFLFIDYVLRFGLHSDTKTAEDLILDSGPDLCILSFGAVVGLVTDRQVHIASTQLLPYYIFGVILLLRYCCLVARKKESYTLSLGFGLGSVFTVLLIPVISYLKQRVF